MKKFVLLPALLIGFIPTAASAAVLFTFAGPLLVNDEAVVNPGGFTLSRTTTADDTLYFKYTVTNPQSNHETENYFAGMQFYEEGNERLGVGNAWGPHAYSAFSVPGGDVDLNSATPEEGQTFQLVRSTDITTIVMRVDYVNGGDDLISLWLNPDTELPEAAQNPALLTTFSADATFDSLVFREGAAGGWTFSDVAVAEQSTDPGFFAVPEPSVVLLGGLGLIGLLRRRRL